MTSKRNPDSVLNVLGKTKYIDDIPEPSSMLHIALVSAPSSHGKFTKLNIEKAIAFDSSVIVVQPKDIPGENQLSMANDEPLLADKEWNYKGETLALVLAKSKIIAKKAASLVSIEGREDLEAIVDPRTAFNRGLVLAPPKIQSIGDIEKGFKESDIIVEGSVESAGQEHVYLETQGAIATPSDDGGIHVISGTQNPSGVQSAIAKVLGLGMNYVNVETRRLGGAFGGKEDQGAPWACMASVAAKLTGKPVKIYLNRRDDMFITGKRHPYSSDFKLGLKKDGTILAYEVSYYQNSGAATDLSPAILPRTLFHANGSYAIPNLKATASMCRTNLVPFTAFRGFGGPQGIFVIECAIEKAARVMGLDPKVIQEKNLMDEGYTMHYGMKMDDVRAKETFKMCCKNANYEKLRNEIDAFNKENKAVKKGIGITPLCFGISFTKIMLNQGGALVHIYNDGSVLVSTGAVEMGQGVNRKITLVTAKTLGVSPDIVKVENTKTITVANTVATAASTGSDINSMASHIACVELNKRLIKIAAGVLNTSEDKLALVNGELVFKNEANKVTNLNFKKLVGMAFEQRIDLSAHAYYATPGLDYDLAKENGNPFKYHVYGCAIVTTTLDVISGVYKFDKAYIVHDVAESIDPLVDLGQVEGGFIQGLGWSCLEELKFNADGRLLSDTLSTYKVPDMDFVPELNIDFYKKENPKAVFNSKAIGEPPLVYGIAGYLAVLDALHAAKPETSSFYDLPMTPEKALDFLVEGKINSSAAQSKGSK